MANAEITGWGYQLGGDIKTTQDFIDEHGVQTTSQDTYELTGIRERSVCAEGEDGVTLSVAAGQLALERAEVEPGDIDMLILATTTNKWRVPGMSADVQYELGMGDTPAFDLNAGCSGAGYALYVAAGLIQSGLNKRVMVMATDTITAITDYNRKDSVLFADASGAVVVEASDRDCGLLGSYLIARGQDRPSLYCELGGKLQMKGHEVFKKAVRLIPEIGNAALERAGLDVSQVDLLIPHQANARITDAGAVALGFKDGAKDKRVANY
ncbi:MAG: 3-oxoacyl-ACP synthase III family protein, partial [Candidatus Micrarchaeaceae archaeon]